MKPSILLALAFAGVFGAAVSGRAAEPLRLDQAVARSLAANPTLAAEAADVSAARARADRDSLPTPYVVGGDLENVVGTGALSGFTSAETTLRLGRVIELGAKRASRQAAGAADVARQQNIADIAQLDIAARTTVRFIEVVVDQQRLAFAKEQVTLAQRTRREVVGWVKAARNPETDLHAADIAVADAELQREHAEHELASARVTLAASWGSATPDFETVAGRLDELPPAIPFEDFATRLPQAIAQRSSQLESDAILARRGVAEAAARPDVNVSLGVRRMEAIDDQGLVMSVSVPLGNKARSRLGVAEADAQLAAVQARREAQRADSHQVLFEKYQELVHARTEYDAVTTRMLPKAEQAMVFSRRGFEAGRFSFTALAQAQRTLFELRERRIEAAARFHTLLADIERMTASSTELTP